MPAGTDQPETFEDPALKAALERVWGGEHAPRVLHERLAKAIQKAAASHIGRRWSGNPLFGLAAAALILLTVGTVAYRFYASSKASSAKGPLTASVALELVETHDQCCAQEDHHMPGLPREDFPAIAKALQARLGLPVLAAAIREEGWRFKGASVCPVGRMQSAHLVFKHGAEDLSVFSLPAAVACPTAPSGSESSLVETGHPITAFVVGNGFYALVGSSPNGSLTMDQMRLLRDEVRPTLSAAGLPSRRIAIAINQ